MKLFHSHKHGLKPTIPGGSGEQICSVCELELPPSGEAYSCTKPDCGFILHKSCCQLPKKFHHNSHPQHAFSLLSEPPEYSHYHSCDACGGMINAFGFQCDVCRTKMHVKCALLPESVECKAHEHNLELYYTESKANLEGCTFSECDVCKDRVTEGYWTYYCKDCDFVTHLDCAASAQPQPVIEEQLKQVEEEEEGLSAEEQLIRARMRMEQHSLNMQIRMQMARQNALFMNNLANSWSSY